MKPKTFFLLPAMAAAAALIASLGTACAQTEMLTFDDISFSGIYETIPYGYGGLQWNNFLVMNTVQEDAAVGINGYVNGAESPSNVAFNYEGGSASFSDNGTFNLNSAYLTGAWRDGLQVEVQGYVGSTLTYDNTYTVNAESPTLINFNYVGVDKVNFISSGGVVHSGYGGSAYQFAMDNLSVTLVPEPTTFALAGLAAVLVTLRSLIQRRTPN